MQQASTRLFGLIGYPLEHSFSEAYFSEKFYREGITNTEYRAFPLPGAADFPALLKRLLPLGLCGLNVTIPHKQSIMPFLDEIAPEAQAANAVNTIKIGQNGRLIGYNTDIFGFEQSLLPLLEKQQHTHALILGTGGAAQAINYVLSKKLGITSRFVSRKATGNNLGYHQLSPEVVKQHTLIVNATPLGTYPKVNAFPNIPYEQIGKRHLLYDLVYNPEKTAFLTKGELQGAAHKNGLEMLYLQAERAWQIWNE